MLRSSATAGGSHQSWSSGCSPGFAPTHRVGAAVAHAAGPLAGWLVELFPTTLAVKRQASAAAAPHALALPTELAELLTLDGETLAAALAERLTNGMLANRHRPLLIELIRRVPAGHLPTIAERLNRAGTNAGTIGLALGLAALATTRFDMLEELQR